MVFTVPKFRREYLGFKGYEPLPISYPRKFVAVNASLYGSEIDGHLN